MDLNTLPCPATTSAGSFCGRTRREFLWEIGGGFGSVALTAFLGPKVSWIVKSVAADGVSPFMNPVRRNRPVRGQGQECDLSVHVWRSQPCRHVRLQAQALSADGKTIALKTFGRGGKKNEGRIVGPKWEFRRYGQSGNRSPRCFPTWRHASTISPSSTRFMPNRRSMARRC